MKTETEIDQMIKKIFEEETSKIEVPENLESLLNTLIDQLDEQETHKKRKHLSRIWLGSAAAAIALLLTIGNLYWNKPADNVNTANTSICNNPDLAYEQAAKALMLVSKKFNKGLNQLTLAETKIMKANSVLDKTLKDIKQ